MGHQPCRHCGEKPGSHKRGFCWGCYHDPHVMALFPADQSKNSGGGDAAWEYTELPVAPTIPYVYLSGPCPYPPGSSGKRRYMVWRDRNGYQPHHPGDNVPDHRRGAQVWEAVVRERARRMED